MAQIVTEYPEIASLGRGGDTMLAHINEHEAKMLMMMGGSGTINPDTGLPEFLTWKKLFKAAAVVTLIFYPPAAIAVGQYLGFTGATAAVVGSATISAGTTLITGGTPEEALRSAAASAVGAFIPGPVADVVGEIGLSGATGNVIGSAAGSAAATAVRGGSPEDILRNAVAGAVGSGISSQGYDTAGRAAGSAISSKGDPLSTLIGSGALNMRDSSNVNLPSGTQVADASNYLRDPGVVSDSPISPIEDVVITAQREPKLTPQVYSNINYSSTGRPKPTEAPSFSSLPDIEIVGKRESNRLPDIEITGRRESNRLPDIEITGRRESDRLPDIEITDRREQPTVGSEQDRETNPRLRPQIYSRVFPSASNVLSRSLGTDLTTSAPTYPASSPTTGLTSTRGAGEIEGEETGGRRRNVWNEESLRLKDALGL
jgi:hypothetical protein